MHGRLLSSEASSSSSSLEKSARPRGTKEVALAKSPLPCYLQPKRFLQCIPSQAARLPESIGMKMAHLVRPVPVGHKHKKLKFPASHCSLRRKRCGVNILSSINRCHCQPSTRCCGKGLPMCAGDIELQTFVGIANASGIRSFPVSTETGTKFEQT